VAQPAAQFTEMALVDMQRTVNLAPQRGGHEAGHRAETVVGEDDFQSAWVPVRFGEQHTLAERPERGRK